jgi:hypothetical protein
VSTQVHNEVHHSLQNMVKRFIRNGFGVIDFICQISPHEVAAHEHVLHEAEVGLSILKS